MTKLKSLISICLVLSSFSKVNAYVHQKTVDGESFTWAGSNSGNVIIYVNGDNSSGISSSKVLVRAQESAIQWNSAGGPSLSVRSTTSGPEYGRNDVYFSNDSALFSGSSVLAVTESVYNAETGRIVESDILIKDSILFTDDKDSDPFIGDLLSHEMGHLIGLDHSGMPFSTMFYKLIRGQQTISFDDLLGKNTLYGQKDYSGKISGYIAGGSDQTPVFGAEIKLISSVSGKAIASTLSNVDGSYTFDGIPLDDVYYIYISPLKALETISEYYQTVKSDFCSGSNNFKGAFYQGCGNSRKGYPLGIELNSASQTIDTGIISIKCGQDVPTGYLSLRGNGAFEIDDKEEKKGDSFVGYFTSSDIETENYDEIYIDLSDVDTSQGNYYLDLKLISQELYSKAGFSMQVSSGVGAYNFEYSITSDNTPNLNLSGQIPLDSEYQSNNIFTIKIIPKEFEQFKEETSFDSESLFFPDFSTFGENKAFYQFIYFLSKEQTNGKIEFEDHYAYLKGTDNNRCMDGEETYGVKSSGSVTGISQTPQNRSSGEDSLLACGSVAFVDGGSGPPDGNGPITIIVGFMITMVLSLLKSRKNSF